MKFSWLIFLAPVLVPVQGGFLHTSSLSSSSFQRRLHQWKASYDPFANDGSPGLYEILGASPKDDMVALKRKWMTLARRLHPDANVYNNMNNLNSNNNNGDALTTIQGSTGMAANNNNPTNNNNNEQYPYDLSMVNAAWNILSDPKTRRRYDRELQAKEMADTFEVLLDAGIKASIPFFRKTAETTVSAVKTSSKTWREVSQTSTKVMNNVNQRMTAAAAIFDLEQEQRDLEAKYV